MPGLGEGPDLPHGLAGWTGRCHHPHPLARAVCCEGSHPGARGAQDVVVIPGAFASTSSPHGPCPALSRRSDLRD